MRSSILTETDLDRLRLVTARAHHHVYYIESLDAIFRFDFESTDDDDDATVIKPNNIADEAPGRWVLKVSGAGGGGGSVDMTDGTVLVAPVEHFHFDPTWFTVTDDGGGHGVVRIGEGVIPEGGGPDATAFHDGGDSFGHDAVLGTGDAKALLLRANGDNLFSLTGDGDGAGLLAPVADTFCDIGSVSKRVNNFIGRAHIVYDAADDIYPSANLSTKTLSLGLGGGVPYSIILAADSSQSASLLANQWLRCPTAPVDPTDLANKAYAESVAGGDGILSHTGGVIRPTTPTEWLQLGNWTGTPSADWTFSNQRFTLRGESATDGGTIASVHHAVTDSTSQGEFTVYRSRGSLASPASVESGDHMARFAAVGYDGAAFRFCVAMDFIAESTFSDGAPYKAAIVFKTGGGTPTEKLRINNDGYLISSAIDGSAVAALITKNLYFEMSYGHPTDTDIRSMSWNNAAGSQKAGFNVNVDGANGYVDIFSATAGGIGFPMRWTATETIALLEMRLINNKALRTKTSGGTTVDLITMDGANTLYVGDSNVPKAQVYVNDIVLGINGSSKHGFFGTAAVNRPTGVSVDAAGIHAALVTLGLITA